MQLLSELAAIGYIDLMCAFLEFVDCHRDEKVLLQCYEANVNTKDP
jgi:hypothetical protein